MKSNLLRSAVMAAVLVGLGGCLSLDTPGPVVVYAPVFQVPAQASATPVGWSLRIPLPNAGDLLDSNNLAVRPEPNQLQNYKGARWSESLPVLLQSAVLRAFEDSGRIGSVARAGVGVRGDVSLLLDIRHFEAVYPTPRTAKSRPLVQVEIQAKLVAAAGGAVLAARTFRQTVEAEQVAVPAVVAAFERATTPLLTQLVDWTLQAGPAAHAQP